MQIGGKTQPAPLNAVYSLTFAEDRISTRVDCNICGGPFRVSGDQVTIGPNLACTRAACATMEFESAYQSVLAGDSTARLDGASLVISSARGSLTFAR
jgi:heat shock protein HslJ